MTDLTGMEKIIDVLQRDSDRYKWALPILTGTCSVEADKRTIALAMQLGIGLEGDAAIDAAMKVAP